MQQGLGGPNPLGSGPAGCVPNLRGLPASADLCLAHCPARHLGSLVPYGSTPHAGQTGHRPNPTEARHSHLWCTAVRAAPHHAKGHPYPKLLPSSATPGRAPGLPLSGVCGQEGWVQGAVGPPRRPPGARTPARTGSPRGTPRSRRRSAPSAGAPRGTALAAPGGSRAGVPRAGPPWSQHTLGGRGAGEGAPGERCGEGAPGRGGQGTPERRGVGGGC